MISPPPGLPVTLPLIHSLSFFLCFSLQISLYFTSPTLIQGLCGPTSPHTHKLFLSLAFPPPHFVSKDSTGESLTHKRKRTFSFLLFHINGFQTCIPVINTNKHSRKHEIKTRMTAAVFVQFHLPCKRTHLLSHWYALLSASFRLLKQHFALKTRFYICRLYSEEPSFSLFSQIPLYSFSLVPIFLPFSNHAVL